MATSSRQTRRTFLLVVDQSPELKVALRYACRRAQATGGRVAMLYVMEPADAEWLTVNNLMREERRAEAEARLQELAAQVQTVAGEMPVMHLREGSVRDQLLALLDEDPSISVLVLGAGTSSEGPGPLITALTGKYSAKLKVPLVMVPGAMTDEAIDAVT
jgi:nucleotide-binding universal stress UspA family protein